MSLSLAGARVLVTGGAGFLGRHVVLALRSRGVADVIVPRSRETDLRDARAVDALFSTARPDVVVHLAARVGGIGANQRAPGTFFRDNMSMGLAVLDAARHHGVRKLVLVGTVCSYPADAPLPFNENDLWRGYPEPTNAAYGVAKRALLTMADAYRREFGAPFVAVIPTNLYGPGDNFDLERGHVIPAMIRKIDDAITRGGETVTLWGDGTPTREFLYVADAAEGIVGAAERHEDGTPLNLGTGIETSIGGVARMIAREMGFGGEISWDTTRPNGAHRRCVDVARARHALDFRPRVSLEEGLAMTIRWYREHCAAAAVE